MEACRHSLVNGIQRTLAIFSALMTDGCFAVKESPSRGRTTHGRTGSSRRAARFELFGPVRDDNELLRRDRLVLRFNVLNHDEPLAIGRDVVGAAARRWTRVDVVSSFKQLPRNTS